MDKEYVMQTAATIRQQLFATTSLNVICSWGALHGFFATEYNDMATLMFKVNGRLFKGNVLISYNEMDYYEIYLKDANGIRLAHHEVYFDQLGDIIDKTIERGTDAKEYDAFCKNELAKLMRGEIG